MKVRMTFDVDERTREAIAYRYGRDKLASRGDIIGNIEGIIYETWTDYRFEMDGGADDDKAANQGPNE